MTSSSANATDSPAAPLDEIDRVGYDPTTRTHHGRFNPDVSGSALLGVVELVSVVTDTPAERLQPLASVLDPDAMEALVSGGGTSVEISFEYSGYGVTVNSLGEVVVHSVDERRER